LGASPRALPGGGGRARRAGRGPRGVGEDRGGARAGAGRGAGL